MSERPTPEEVFLALELLRECRPETTALVEEYINTAERDLRIVDELLDKEIEYAVALEAKVSRFRKALEALIDCIVSSSAYRETCGVEEALRVASEALEEQV